MNLFKMSPEYNNPVQYYLRKEDKCIHMNELIGKKISLTYLHKINCIKCGCLTKTSFAQGYCYPCFISSPETEECVLRPELCRAHEGIARDIEYAKSHCLIKHYVYLAVSGGIKVGVTRNTQVPERWIDQGAERAIKIAETPNRYIAGTIEVALKNILPDKTNWRDMLTGKNFDEIDIIAEKGKALRFLHKDFKSFASENNEITYITYPVVHYPRKVKTINFDNTEKITEVLTGIKGQYLLFESGIVLNIRKHNGYMIEIDW